MGRAGAVGDAQLGGLLVAASRHVSDVMVAASIYGYVYVSADGGDSWDKLQKEFGEIRSLALTPND